MAVSCAHAWQADLLAAAKERLAKGTLEPASYEEMAQQLEGSDGSAAPGFFLVPWYHHADIEHHHP
jgi:hypothetical protein